MTWWKFVWVIVLPKISSHHLWYVRKGFQPVHDFNMLPWGGAHIFRAIRDTKSRRWVSSLLVELVECFNLLDYLQSFRSHDLFTCYSQRSQMFGCRGMCELQMMWRMAHHVECVCGYRHPCVHMWENMLQRYRSNTNDHVEIISS